METHATDNLPEATTFRHIDAQGLPSVFNTGLETQDKGSGNSLVKAPAQVPSTSSSIALPLTRAPSFSSRWATFGSSYQPSQSGSYLKTSELLVPSSEFICDDTIAWDPWIHERTTPSWQHHPYLRRSISSQMEKSVLQRPSIAEGCVGSSDDPESLCSLSSRSSTRTDDLSIPSMAMSVTSIESLDRQTTPIYDVGGIRPLVRSPLSSLHLGIPTFDVEDDTHAVTPGFVAEPEAIGSWLEKRRSNSFLNHPRSSSPKKSADIRKLIVSRRRPDFPADRLSTNKPVHSQRAASSSSPKPSSASSSILTIRESKPGAGSESSSGEIYEAPEQKSPDRLKIENTDEAKPLDDGNSHRMACSNEEMFIKEEDDELYKPIFYSPQRTVHTWPKLLTPVNTPSPLSREFSRDISNVRRDEINDGGSRYNPPSSHNEHGLPAEGNSSSHSHILEFSGESEVSSPLEEEQVEISSTSDSDGDAASLSGEESDEDLETPGSIDIYEDDWVSTLQEALSTLTTELLSCATEVLSGPLEFDESNCRRCHTDNGGSSSSRPNTTASGAPTQASRKRGMGFGGSSNPDDDEEDGARGRKKRPRPNSPLVQQIPAGTGKFACPFHKRSPQKYSANGGKEYRICAGPGWDEVYRVKEHLYRNHLIYDCQRCCAAFRTEEELSNHTKAKPACEPRHRPVNIDGITNKQEKTLRGKKRKSNLTEPEKWKEMYRIVFPEDAEIPSPYYDFSSYLNTSTVTATLVAGIARRDPKIRHLMSHLMEDGLNRENFTREQRDRILNLVDNFHKQACERIGFSDGLSLSDASGSEPVNHEDTTFAYQSLAVRNIQLNVNNSRVPGPSSEVMTLSRSQGSLGTHLTPDSGSYSIANPETGPITPGNMPGAHAQSQTSFVFQGSGHIGPTGSGGSGGGGGSGFVNPQDLCSSSHTGKDDFLQNPYGDLDDLMGEGSRKVLFPGMDDVGDRSLNGVELPRGEFPDLGTME
ncbi:hypothetical protein AJ80_02324 [Polytolypa hystricis UAMH7299]|uniref:C2H2-type domain-containing protein n=1 Tax=Polytolypa hystricis (strain UAMH7299) TaxID=1447883 RepID=A0A2B7YHH9_POLH7|nr:hypothetical protein AJ80_02324 [Polytolypa hystricis UAMH7299]